MSERWLVTGAKGFLGRHVCAALGERSFDVVPLDRRPPAQPGGLIADLAAEVPRLGPTSPDVVVHLASLVHHQAPAEAFERAIVDGTGNLLAALDRLENPPRALIYASSVAVYGRTQGELLPESTPPAATNVYGLSKHRAEGLIQEWAGARGVGAAILRLPGIVGAGMQGSLARLVRRLGSRFYVGIGRGSARRSLVLASDVAAALPAISGHEGVFHLTDRAHPSFRELETAISRRLGRLRPPRMPLTAARLVARACDLARRAGAPLSFSSETLRRATSTLTFEDSAAVERFGWAPEPILARIESWVPLPGRIEEARSESEPEVD